jgi:hypothetical protein
VYFSPLKSNIEVLKTKSHKAGLKYLRQDLTTQKLETRAECQAGNQVTSRQKNPNNDNKSHRFQGLALGEIFDLSENFHHIYHNGIISNGNISAQLCNFIQQKQPLKHTTADEIHIQPPADHIGQC